MSLWFQIVSSLVISMASIGHLASYPSPYPSVEELLEGFWSDMIGNTIAGFFFLNHFSGKMHHWQIQNI